MNTWSETMKQWRDDLAVKRGRKVSQEEAARLMDVSVFTYNRWENGKQTPSSNLVRKAAMEIVSQTS